MQIIKLYHRNLLYH